MYLFTEGFRRLDLGAPIFLAHSDWEHSCIAVGCHSDEGMNKAEFEAMIRTDLDLYVQRHLEAAVSNTAEDSVVRASSLVSSRFSSPIFLVLFPFVLLQ